jgi:DnaJ-class molecular chaperone
MTKNKKNFDQDEYCEKCGSSVYYEDCWKCGGEGGRGYEDDLQFEDPLWYSPDDFIKCDECEGKGAFKICLNEDCQGE